MDLQFCEPPLPLGYGSFVCQCVLGRTLIDRVINGAWLSNSYFKVVAYCCDMSAMLLHGFVTRCEHSTSCLNFVELIAAYFPVGNLHFLSIRLLCLGCAVYSVVIAEQGAHRH